MYVICVNVIAFISNSKNSSVSKKQKLLSAPSIFWWILIGCSGWCHFFEHIFGNNSSSMSALKTKLKRSKHTTLHCNKQHWFWDRCFSRCNEWCLSGLKPWVDTTLCVKRTTSEYLIITKGKTACIDDVHYSKYLCFCVSGCLMSHQWKQQLIVE